MSGGIKSVGIDFIFAIISGIASSLVATYTATKVATDIFLLAKRSVDMTEKPHCGTEPTREPKTGDHFPFNNFDFSSFCVPLYSINSSKK